MPTPVAKLNKQPIHLACLPPFPLKTDHSPSIIKFLKYAGIEYSSPHSGAALLGVDAFRTCREFGRTTPFKMIAYDVDHTAGDFQIFESLWRLGWTKIRPEYPFKKDYPMTALETARPFFHEMVMGTMVGFAIQQGVANFSQFNGYIPQVGFATVTWPRRLGQASRHIPLISLVDGRRPGEEDSYEKTVASQTFVHLHDFLDYAERLLKRFREEEGFADLNPGDRKGVKDFLVKVFRKLTPEQRDEVMTYFRKGKAHDSKPRGAIAGKWGLDTNPLETGALMIWDDSHEIFKYYLEQAAHRVVSVFVPNPYTGHGKDVGELDKITFGLTRESRIRRAARRLAKAESRTPVPALLEYLDQLAAGKEVKAPYPPQLSETPEGAILKIHEIRTTLREFHQDYVEPTNRLKEMIKELLEKFGGLKVVEEALVLLSA